MVAFAPSSRAAALAALPASELDLLVIGNCIVRKDQQATTGDASYALAFEAD